MVTTHSPSGSVVANALAKSKLGIPSVVFFVLAAVAPLTVIAGGATTAYAVTGLAGVPLGYLAVAVLLMLFSVGYVAMSRRIVNAGAFYTYIAVGLGRTSGVSAAFVAVFAYNAMQIGLYGAFGVVASQVVEQAAGAKVAWWVCALVGWLVVALLGVRRVDLNGKVLGVLMVLEIIIVLTFDGVMFTHPSGGVVSFEAIDPANLAQAGMAAILVGAIAGFTGFEGTAIFSEETKNPQRTVARATYIAVLLSGVLYGLSAWAMSVKAGPENIAAQAKKDETELFFNLAAPHVPEALVSVGWLFFLTSLFAALLAFHNVVARYLFALGREGVLPEALGRTAARTGAPKLGSIVQTVLAVIVIAVYAVGGWDPITYLFFWVTVAGGLGVLILMVGTSMAVIGFFDADHRGENIWRRVIAPVLSTQVLGVLLLVTVANYYTLIDVPADSVLAWMFPAAYGVLVLAGMGWGLYLRAVRPQVYAAIGAGAEAAAATAAIDPLPLAHDEPYDGPGAGTFDAPYDSPSTRTHGPRSSSPSDQHTPPVFDDGTAPHLPDSRIAAAFEHRASPAFDNRYPRGFDDRTSPPAFDDDGAQAYDIPRPRPYSDPAPASYEEPTPRPHDDDAPRPRPYRHDHDPRH